MKSKYNILLFPFVILWRISWFIHRKILSFNTYQFNKPVFIIGSLDIGGGGRTTMVEALSRFLTENHIRHEILCNQIYQRSLKSNLAVQNFASKEYSDEAVLLHQECQVDVWCSPNRAKIIQERQKLSYIQCFICDDGLEDPRLAVGILCLILKKVKSKSNQWSSLFPMGKQRSLISDHPNIQIELDMSSNGDIIEEFECPLNHNKEILSINESFILLSGIGNYTDLVYNLKSLGYKNLLLKELRDHEIHLAKILLKILNTTDQKIVMTPKDAIKLDLNTLVNPRIYICKKKYILSKPIQKQFLSYLNKE